MAKRNGSPGEALDPALSQKKRARRRLIGAAAVALAAAIALPMLLDPEPREQLPEVEVEIPSRDVPLRPLQPGPAAVTGTTTGTGGAPASSSPPSSSSVESVQGSVPARATTEAAPPPPTTSGPSKKPTTKPAAMAKPPAQTPSKPPAEAAKPAKAETGSAAAADTAKSSPDPADPAVVIAGAETEAERRFGLQVGAYANPESAKTMAARARKAGVRAYTETIQTPEGARTRVRIGPFADREAAERSRGKLKLVGIDSTVVSLQR